MQLHVPNKRSYESCEHHIPVPRTIAAKRFELSTTTIMGSTKLRKEVKPSHSEWIPARYTLSFLIFWGFFIVYALRVNLSVAIVAMVNGTAILANSSDKSSRRECSQYLNLTESGDDYSFRKSGEFNWDEKTQGIILGAFFYGYVVTQVPGGRLAERVGGKWLLGGGVLLTSLLTLLTPICARLGVEALVINRIITGLGEGVTYPSLFALFAQWIPIHERSIHVAISGLGASVGTIVALPASAILCEHGFAGGWPSVFYVFGAFGCLWSCIWMMASTSRPADHATITPAELQYIQKSIDTSSDQAEFSSVPWRRILTSAPVISLAITKFCGSWGFYLLLTDLPNYLNFILHFSIENNGWLNAVVYIASSVTLMAGGFLADFMRIRGHFSVTTIRKIFQTVSLVGPAFCLAAIPMFGCNRLAVILLLTSSMAVSGFTSGGEGPVVLDIAPNYAGTVFGLTNGFSNLAGVFAPLVTGIFTQKNETIESWGSVFQIAAVVYIVGALVFLFFGSARVQTWSLSTNYRMLEPTDLKMSSDEEETDMLGT